MIMFACKICANYPNFILVPAICIFKIRRKKSNSTTGHFTS